MTKEKLRKTHLSQLLNKESHLTYELDINDQREISNNPCILESDSTANNENDLTENRTEFNNQLTSEMCQQGEVVNANNNKTMKKCYI